MKTKLKNLFFLQFLLLCSLVISTSCSSDNDEYSTTPSIVGTWNCDGVSGYTLKFNSNHTGKEIMKTDGNYLEGDFEYIYDGDNSLLKIVGSNESMILENGTYNNVTVGVNKMNFQGLSFTKK